MAADDPWRKPSQQLVEQFHEAVAGIEGVEVRRMFGYPAAFVGGNLTAGLHQESFMVRLSEADRAEPLADGWSPFEPMPGRPMREYVVLPAEVVADADATRVWVERAAGYVRTLPPKASKAPKRAGKNPAAAMKPRSAGVASSKRMAVSGRARRVIWEPSSDTASPPHSFR